MMDSVLDYLGSVLTPDEMADFQPHTSRVHEIMMMKSRTAQKKFDCLLKKSHPPDDRWVVNHSNEVLSQNGGGFKERNELSWVNSC